MAYCVFTCKKPKTGAADGGLSAHIDREKWDGKEHKMVPFVPDSVIHPELSHLNREYLLPPGMGRTEAINKRIMEAGITRKIRDDQAKFLAFLCTSDRETMLQIYNEGRWQAWVDANISFMQKTFGKENVVGCAGHMDEVTFHLHFTVVPILMGQAAERPDTKKQFEKRNGKEKRRYKKQEVTARLCAKDIFTPANAEQWQTDYALHMQAAGFELQRGEVGSQAKHMDPATYNAIQTEIEELLQERVAAEQELAEKKQELVTAEDELRSAKSGIWARITQPAKYKEMLADERKAGADEAMDAATCIGCGACVAACKNGSAMLFVSAKVSQLNLLPQGKPEALRRAKAMLSKMDELGFGNCTNTRACEAECPKNISISNIARLNRDFIIAKLKD